MNLDSLNVSMINCSEAQILTKEFDRVSILFAAAGLRGRSPENKANIVSEVEKNVWPAIASGKIKPVVYKSFPLEEAVEAHQLLESSKHIGKIILLVE